MDILEYMGRHIWNWSTECPSALETFLWRWDLALLFCIGWGMLLRHMVQTGVIRDTRAAQVLGITIAVALTMSLQLDEIGSMPLLARNIFLWIGLAAFFFLPFVAGPFIVRRAGHVPPTRLVLYVLGLGLLSIQIIVLIFNR